MKKLFPVFIMYLLLISSLKGQTLKGNNVIDFEPVRDAAHITIDGNIYIAASTMDKALDKGLDGNNLTLYSYSSTLQLQYQKSLMELLPLKASFFGECSMFVFKKSLIISATIKEKNVYTRILILVDPKDGKVINSYKMLEAEYPKEYPYLSVYTCFSYYIFNEDSTKMIFAWDYVNMNQKRNVVVNCLIFDNQLNKVNDVKMDFAVNIRHKSMEGIFFYRNTIYSWIYETRVGHQEGSYLYAYNIDTKKMEEVLLDLPRDYSLVQKMKMHLIPGKGFILLALVDQDGPVKGDQGIFTAEFDNTNTLIEKKYYPFSEEFKAGYYIPEKKITMLAYMNVLNSAVTSEGEIYLILERGDLFFAAESKEDVTVLKIKKGVGYEWTKRIKKHQVPGNKIYSDHNATATYFQNGNIYILYIDTPENKTISEAKPKTAAISDENAQLRLVTIYKEGNVDSKFTDGNVEDKKCKFYPYRPFMVDNKFLLTYEVLKFGHADYLKHFAFRLCSF